MSEGDHGESLRTQLRELNERARWYSTQLWQLPLAYIGLGGVGLAGVVEKAPGYVPYLLLGISLIGYAILFHMFGVQSGMRRAVRSIRQVEALLELERTAMYCPLYTFPLEVLILLVALAASGAPWPSLGVAGQGIVAVVAASVLVVSAALFVKAWPTAADKQ